jgi:hypothetical protein
MRLAGEVLQQSRELRYRMKWLSEGEGVRAELKARHSELYGAAFEGLEAARKRDGAGKTANLDEWNAWDAARREVQMPLMLAPEEPKFRYAVHKVWALELRSKELLELATGEPVTKDSHNRFLLPEYERLRDDLKAFLLSEESAGLRESEKQSGTGSQWAASANLSKLSFAIHGSPHSQAENAHIPPVKTEKSGGIDGGWMAYM